MALRAFPVTYASDVEAVERFWELLGFRRHVQLPPEGAPGYIGLTRDGAGELAVTDEQWAADRYGLSPGTGPRFEMYVYIDDLDAMLVRLAQAQVTVLREAEDMPVGRTDRDGCRSRGQPRRSVSDQVVGSAESRYRRNEAQRDRSGEEEVLRRLGVGQ